MFYAPVNHYCYIRANRDRDREEEEEEEEEEKEEEDIYREPETTLTQPKLTQNKHLASCYRT